MAERIRLAARMERKAVAGPWTAEKGPHGVGIRNIAKMQIARMTGPTLNNRKLTSLVLRSYGAMSIREALPSLPPQFLSAPAHGWKDWTNDSRLVSSRCRVNRRLGPADCFP